MKHPNICVEDQHNYMPVDCLLAQPIYCIQSKHNDMV